MPAAWRGAAFRDTALYKAGVLLRAAGRPSLAEWFFESLADTFDAGGVARLGRALEEMGAPHLQVMVGKAAARRGIVVPAPYFALHPLHEMELPVPAELALAIARRESEFDADVRSGAGAMGLMQLMPGTAAEMAGERGLAHARGRLMSDWRYNARLGAAYLAQLTARFDGNVTLVAAAYNAGPSRALRWMEARGDPRGRPEAEIVDWIEHIPFRETRNYVMRTAESLPVYRARLGRAVRPVPFPRELAGATLLPRGE
jgi:soluble lytic murein transglycosylase